VLWNALIAISKRFWRIGVSVCSVVLPSYSRHAPVKMKHIPRKTHALTKEALGEAVVRALRAVSTEDVRDFSFTAAAAPRRSDCERRC
jgi:hypothetical protein